VYDHSGVCSHLIESISQPNSFRHDPTTLDTDADADSDDTSDG
jgi:hypothetical protein